MSQQSVGYPSLSPSPSPSLLLPPPPSQLPRSSPSKKSTGAPPRDHLSSRFVAFCCAQIEAALKDATRAAQLVQSPVQPSSWEKVCMFTPSTTTTTVTHAHNRRNRQALHHPQRVGVHRQLWRLARLPVQGHRPLQTAALPVLRSLAAAVRTPGLHLLRPRL